MAATAAATAAAAAATTVAAAGDAAIGKLPRRKLGLASPATAARRCPAAHRRLRWAANRTDGLGQPRLAAAPLPRRVPMLSPTCAAATDSPVGTMELDVVETAQPNSRIRLDVTVPSKICREMYDGILKEFSKQAKIPGFRPGKRIPEQVLTNYYGQTSLNSATVEAVLKASLPEAMSSVAGRALKESEHIVSKWDDLCAAFSPSEPLSFAVAVDIAPEVKWVSEKAYANLTVQVPYQEVPVEAAVDDELRSRVKDLGSLAVSTTTGLQMGNVAIIDISATRINDDGTAGEKILSAEQKGFQLDTEDLRFLLPGFVEALLGLERGESRTFDLSFPGTWQQEALRGVPARFTAHCKELFLRILPELNDELAPKLVEGATTLDQVREVLFLKHCNEGERAKRAATQEALMSELAKVTVIDVPNSLLEEQGRQLYAAKLIELQASGRMTKEQVTSLSSQEMVTNYLRAQKDMITNVVKQTLAVAEIYKLETLSFAEEELKAEIENATEEFKRYNQEYDEGRLREQATEMLEGAKVLDWLLEHATITYA
eukprot:SM000039S14425  [mRNA]  locus=s39:74488:79033:- [translate_table: standard]